MSNNLQSSLQRALDGLQDALEFLPDDYCDPHTKPTDYYEISVAIYHVQKVARANSIKLVEKESL